MIILHKAEEGFWQMVNIMEWQLHACTITIKEAAQVRVKTWSSLSASNNSARVDCRKMKSFSVEHGDEWVYRALKVFDISSAI